MASFELRDIPEYEGLYQIASDGSVYSLPRNGTRSKAPYLMRGSADNHGYRQVSLTKGGETKTVKVHKLVASVFVPNPLGLPEVNHKDEDKNNNDASNLEWCNRAYNNRYGMRTQKTRKRVDQLALDGSYIKTYDGIGLAAKALGSLSSMSDISRCCDGKRKTAMNYKWRWAK